MISARTGVAIGLLLVGLVVVACDDSRPPTFIDSDGFGEPDFKRPPSSVPPPTSFGGGSRCPGFDPPLLGSNCTFSSFDESSDWDGTCEYGHDLDGACNEHFECSNQRWTRSLPMSKCLDRCPSTLTEILPGSACDDAAVGCSYLEGTCGCMADSDAGATDGGSLPIPGHWRCVKPPGGSCPPQRPALQSDCVRSMVCDYGTATLQRSLTFECFGGKWIQTTAGGG